MITAKEAKEVSDKAIENKSLQAQTEMLSEVDKIVRVAASKGANFVTVATRDKLSQKTMDSLRENGFVVTKDIHSNVYLISW